MKQIIFKPEIHLFDSCREFVDSFSFSKNDLIITNKYIYEPHFKTFNIPSRVIYQELYGTGEPTDIMTENIIHDIESGHYNRIIAIGGGTIIDIAKVLAVAENANIDSLYEKAPVLSRHRELIILPTTCGTGSEVTNISVLNRTRLGVKMGLVSESMYATAAILIPELLKELPYQVFATSSIDALIHAVESALSPQATSYTRLFSYKAIDMILRGYQKIAFQGPDARVPLLKDFMLASNYAGLSFGTAGCAAVHAMSYPFGAACHVAHGESNYVMFTGVLKKYLELRNDGEISVLNAYIANILGCSVPEVYVTLEELLNQILCKKALREYGVTEEMLESFTDSVITTQTRLLSNNFVPLDRDHILKIYKELF